MIEDFSSGGRRLSGLSDYLEKKGIKTESFEWDGRGNIHICLQNIFYRLRSECSDAFIAASGTGIAGALALGVQLPVERMVFIEGRGINEVQRPEIRRQLSRIYRFSQRNAAFCISDILLVVSGGDAVERRMRTTLHGLSNRRFGAVEIYECADNKLCTNGEHLPELPIYRFLKAGESPKLLAENPEMCIIYE